MTIKKEGDWKAVDIFLSDLKVEMQKARKQSLMRFGLRAEKIALEHISRQDLSWDPLSEQYKKFKADNGLSTDILVATSSYFQAITSWVDRTTAYAGVKRGAKNKDGEDVANIARILEYGEHKRPLWQPTYKEALELWAEHDKPITIFMANIKKKHKV